MEVVALSDFLNDFKVHLQNTYKQSQWIYAEITKIQQSKGHLYIELAEKDPTSDRLHAQIQAVLWSNQYLLLRHQYQNQLDQVLKAGLQISFEAQIQYHEIYGLKINILDINPSHTLGHLALKREQIINKLKKEKAIGKNASLPLPPVIQNIAVISSLNAAGWEDFKTSLQKNRWNFTFKIDLFPAAVQGKNVEYQVCEQIKNIYQSPTAYDVIVITRGGGSKIDLSYFDSYQLGRYVAHVPIPVFSGIGHEIDQSVVDIAAHSTFKTPTATAEYIINHNQDFLGFLEQSIIQLGQSTRDLLHKEERQLIQWKNKLKNSTNLRIQSEAYKLQNIEHRIGSLSKQRIREEKQKLSFFQSKIDILDINNVLKRGFALIYQDKNPVKSVQDLSVDKSFEIQFYDGRKNISKSK